MKAEKFKVEDVILEDLNHGCTIAQLRFDGEETLFIPAMLYHEDYPEITAGMEISAELVAESAPCRIYENEEAYKKVQHEEMERTGRHGMWAAECFSNLGVKTRGKGERSRSVPAAIIGANVLSVREEHAEFFEPYYVTSAVCLGCHITFIIDSGLNFGIPQKDNIIHGIFTLYAEKRES